MSLSQTITNEEANEKSLYMACPQTLLDEHKEKSQKLDSEIIFSTESSFMKQVTYLLLFVRFFSVYHISISYLFSGCFQVGQLAFREAVNSKRDTAALIGRFGVTIFLSILFGLIFLNAGGKDDTDNSNFNSHFGAIAMILISSMFGSAQPTMLSFPYERPMFLREYSTGTCKFLFFLFLSFLSDRCFLSSFFFLLFFFDL
jgi:hypothetical protein